MKDTHDLRLEFRKFDGEDGAARMKDEVASWRQKIEVTAQSFSHAALDTVALVSFADHFADGKPDARGGGVVCFGAGVLRAGSEEPTHRCGLAFAACGIDALIIRMLTEAYTCQRLHG